jgi:hypothetical protein
MVQSPWLPKQGSAGGYRSTRSDRVHDSGPSSLVPKAMGGRTKLAVSQDGNANGAFEMQGAASSSE